MLKFYVAPAIVDECQEFLKVPQPKAVKEFMKQVTRLTKLYTSKPAKRGARYWNKVDTMALYSLAHNEQMRRSQINRALTDLERVEAMRNKMTSTENEVYDKFLYFLNIIGAKLTCDEFKQKIDAFVQNYSDEARAYLLKLIEHVQMRPPKSDGDEKVAADPLPDIARSVQDAARRVRSALVNSRTRATFGSRLVFAAEHLVKQVPAKNLLAIADEDKKTQQSEPTKRTGEPLLSSVVAP